MMPRSAAISIMTLLIGMASAQDYRNSTPPAEITAYKQAAGNFSTTSNIPFPCSDLTASSIYEAVALDQTRNQDLLSAVVTSTFEYFLYSTFPLTGCSIRDVPDIPLIDVSQACVNQESFQASVALCRAGNFLPSLFDIQGAGVAGQVCVGISDCIFVPGNDSWYCC